MVATIEGAQAFVNKIWDLAYKNRNLGCRAAKQARDIEAEWHRLGTTLNSGEEIVFSDSKSCFYICIKGWH